MPCNPFPSGQLANDPCAEFPDAPVPEPYRPAPGTRARVGTKKPRNLYLVPPDQPDGLDIGRCDLPEYAALAIKALNVYLAAEHRWEYGVEGRWPDGGTNLDWRGSREAAEQVLAARAEIEGNVVVSRLVRRPILVGPVEEVHDDA